MTQQPEALRLADRLTSFDAGPWDNLDAAAELRRLSAINAQLLAALQALALKPPSDYRDWDYQDSQEHKQSFGHHLGTNAVAVTWPKL